MFRVILFAALLTAYGARAADAPASQSSDTLLPDDSHWSGTLLRDPRLAASKDRACKAHITSRDGQKFTATYSNQTQTGRVAVELEGTIDKNGQIRAKVTKVIDGETTQMGKEWTGQANDKEWLLEFKNPNGAVRRAELKIEAAKHASKKGKKDKTE